MTGAHRSNALRFVIALAVTLGALGLMLSGPFAVAVATAQRPGEAPAPTTTTTTNPTNKPVGGNLTLLGQSAWVSQRQAYHLRLGVVAGTPSGDELQVVVYSPLTTRTGFDEAMSGQIHGYETYDVRVPVSALPPDPAGGVDIDIPVNEASTGRIPSFYTSAGSAVFPAQVALINASGAVQGAPIDTFLVYGEPPSVSGLPKLSVSLVLPFQATPPVRDDGSIGPLPASESARLAELVDTLAAHPGIKLTLAITPETLEALDSSSASHVDRATLATIVDLVHDGNVEVVPGTYADVPLQGWGAAGLDSELSDQLATGSSVLAGILRTAPSARTWVVNGSLDNDALRALEADGARQLIVPDADLTPLPAVAQETTFALPTQLVGSGRAVVYGADPGLTADFSNPGGAALAASQLLAEMAMIQLETPGNTRGVAVLPPSGWSENAAFLDTLLTGLQGHPLLKPVTASGLFAAVPVFPLQRSLLAHPTSSSGEPGGQATGGSTAGTGAIGAAPGGSPVLGSQALGSQALGSTGATGPGSVSTGSTGTIAGAQPGLAAGPGSSRSVTTLASGSTGDIGAALGPDVSAILGARRGLAGMVAVLPQEAKRVVVLNEELLTAESTDLNEDQRQGLLTQIQAAITKVTSLITLPRSSSITLTSTRGSIPLTVLSTSSEHARVELRLSSERLLFQVFTPPNGRCTVPTSTSEVCDLTLTTHNTTLKVPVETRTSGVFPVEVSLWTPDGSQLIAQARDTVRSTAVSGVGVVLILVAIVSLGIWWIRDLRHGRRARQLVPAPEDEALGGEDEVTANDVMANGSGGAGPEVDDGRLLPTTADLPIPGTPDPETVVRQVFLAPAAEHRDRTSGTLS